MPLSQAEPVAPPPAGGASGCAGCQKLQRELLRSQRALRESQEREADLQAQLATLQGLLFGRKSETPPPGDVPPAATPPAEGNGIRLVEGARGGWGAVRSVSATARSGPRGRGRFAGSETMPCSASCSRKRVARRTRLAPEPACQCKCSQTVRASSVRLSPEQACTISCTSEICRRVRRLPKNVVEGRS